MTNILIGYCETRDFYQFITAHLYFIAFYDVIYHLKQFSR